MQLTRFLASTAIFVAPALCQTTTGSPTIATGTPASTSADVASLVSQLPTCALPCLNSAAAAINCTTTDLTCICSKADQLTTNIGPCILLGSCNSADQSSLISSAQQICANINAAQPSQLAAASSYIASAVSSESASSTASGSMARRTDAPVAGVGLMGAAAALAMLAL